LDELDTSQKFTIFVPNDEAFEKILQFLTIGLEDLVAEEDLLSLILNYHIIPGASLKTSDLNNNQKLGNYAEG